MINTEVTVITIKHLKELPKLTRQIDGEELTGIAAKYPGQKLYILEHDYTFRVWVELEDKKP